MSKRGSPHLRHALWQAAVGAIVLTRNSRFIMNADALMVSIVTSFLVLSPRRLLNRIFVIPQRIGLTKFATSLLMFGFCYKLVLDSS